MGGSWVQLRKRLFGHAYRLDYQQGQKVDSVSEELTREEWQAGELWNKFVAWVKGSAVAIVVVIAIIGLIAWLVNGYQKHEADTAEAVGKVQVSPESNAAATPKKPKIATKKVAPKATNTPPIVEFGSMVQKPVEPLSQFEISVIAFETEIKRNFP